MEREHILAKINTKLAIFETEVRIANANNEYDINRHAQTMLIPVLDIVFGCEFMNLDYAEKRNFPAIDLGSPEKRLAVQVTSTGTTNKVAHSLEVFNKYGLGKEYSFLLFYFIQKPQKAISLSSRLIVKNMGRLEPNNICFLTNDDLYEKLAGFSIDRLQAVLDILQKEYPDAAESLPSATALTPLPSYDHDTRLIGRDSILKDLKTVLMNSFPVIVLTGPGGIGKTSIAARLCHDIKEEDSASVAWITYSDDLRSGLLKLELYQDLDPAQRLEHILRYLKTTSRPLYLFIDNMRTSFRQTDIGLINQFSPSVRVFITSRYRTSAFQCIRLRPLDLDAAAAMYEAYSNHTIPADERDDFKRLLAHTSSNTLLIELLAKFASRKFLTLTALMKQLESQGILSMNAGSLETVYSKKPMAIRDFVLDLYNISELSSEQKRIMKLLSIFPAERPVTLKVAEWASFDMTELHHLSEWGWVKYSFSDAAPCNTADACPVKNTAVPSPDEKHIGLPKSLYLHSIIKDTVSAQDNAQLDFNNYGGFLKKVSGTHYYLGRGTPFSTAQEDIIVPEAVADYRLIHHMYDARTAYLCLNLSKSFKRNGDLEKAKKYVKKARGIYQKVCGRDSSQTARVLRQYAAVLCGLGELDLAFNLAQKSLAIYERIAEPSAAASSYDLLGTICSKAGTYDDAWRYLDSALSIRKKSNPEASDTANTLHHLGIVYCKIGRADDAIACLEKALAIRKVRLNENHIQTASTFSRIGDAYRAKKYFKDALRYYGQAFEMFKALSALGHPFAESTYLGLGYCYKELGETAKAADAFSAAYKICLSVYGPDHPHTIEAKKQMH